MSPLQAPQTRIIALLHLAPRPGDVEFNKRLIERAVVQAASLGARLIVTPELCLSGYGFRDLVGTTWIAGERQPARLDWAARPGAKHRRRVPGAGPTGSGRRCSLQQHDRLRPRRPCDRTPSKDRRAAGRLRVLVQPRRSADGCRHPRHRTCGAVRLRRHVLEAPRRRDGRAGLRSPALVRGLGAGRTWSERRMGMGFPHDAKARAGLQPDRNP